MPLCDCQTSALGFTGWESFQKVAKGEFPNIPQQGGVYCLRVGQVGETDLERIISNFTQSPLQKAYQEMADGSEEFFYKCGFGRGRGWSSYAKGAINELATIRDLSLDSQKQVACPILYIGRGKSLHKRIWDLMDWRHPFSHPLWALSYSNWIVELAFRPTADHRAEESRLKKGYRLAHDGKLPLFMKR